MQMCRMMTDSVARAAEMTMWATARTTIRDVEVARPPGLLD